MSKKSQNILSRIILMLIAGVLISAKQGFCLSPSIMVDSNILQKEFEQKNAGDKILPTLFWQESTASSEAAKDFMKLGLKQLGYKITIIDNFDPDTILELNPQIAVLNPESAKELGNMLRTLNPNIKIIIISGYPLSEQDVSSMGGDYFLYKNYGISQFAEFLKGVKKEIDSNRGNGNKHNHLKLLQTSDYQVESFAEHKNLYKQLGNKALEYERRLLRRKSDGALFFLKTRYQPRELDQMNFIWEQKNDPLREAAVFALGRYMDANVCDIVLPDQEQAKILAAYIGALPDDVYLVRVAGDYKLSDEQVRQKNFNAAFTRNLVLSILTRKYDFHQANHAPVLGSNVPMMFDNDQSFNEKIIDIDRFTVSFMENFFSSFRYNAINSSQLLDFIDLKELVRTVEFLENKLQIDKVLDIVETKDANKTVQIYLHLEYAEKRAKTLRSDMLEFFNILAAFRQAYEPQTHEYSEIQQQFNRIKQALSEDVSDIAVKDKILESTLIDLEQSI